MEFSIVTELVIIEEVCKAANRPTACFSVAEINVNQQFFDWLFQIPISFE